MKSFILFVFFGGLAAIINAIVYFIASWWLGTAAWLATIIAWVFAAAFAFFTNKTMVFGSVGRTRREVLRETSLFFATRILTLLLNVAIIFAAVDVMNLHEPTFFVVAQAVVLVANYAAGKFLIFKKSEA